MRAGATGRRAAATRLVGRLLTAWIGVTGLTAAPLHAHDLKFTYTVIVVREDDSYQIDVTADLDALALGIAQGVDARQVVEMMHRLSPEELTERIARLRRIFDERVQIRVDGERVRPDLSFPEHGTPATDDAQVPTVLGLTARFEGRLPAGAGEITIQAARSFPPVYLTVIDLRHGRDQQQVLTRGAASAPYPLDVDQPIASRGRLRTAVQYLGLGVWHIVPEGLDHILFVLGLFLLSSRLRPLLWQVTAFTIAHTVTLALSSYGVIALPSTTVEPLIALSIAYVAVENLFTRELTPWRPLVVFGFGLLHGMGFAGVLGELGLPDRDFLTALLSFNLGVEAGQLSVILLAFLTLGWFRHRAWYRARATVPLSLVIALVGLYWFVERVSLA